MKLFPEPSLDPQMINSISETRFTKQAWRRLLLVGIVVVALSIGLNFWTFIRPTSVMQEFIRRILIGQFDGAARMMSIPCRIATNGNLHHLTALDGSSGEIPVGKAELYVLHEPKRPARDGIADYLFCRQHFQICAIWNDDHGAHFVPIYCTTRGSAVVIDHVGITE